jgi:hypothetical protein
MGDGKARKIVFIDKRFQGAFILKFVLLLLVGTAFFVLAAYLILNRRLEETYYSAHFAIKSTGDVLLPTLLALSGVFILVLGAAAVVITLYVSHHIAGPLFAIRRYLENISRGELISAAAAPHDQTSPGGSPRRLETLNPGSWLCASARMPACPRPSFRATWPTPKARAPSAAKTWANCSRGRRR